jgi:hypothetical protein
MVDLVCELPKLLSHLRDRRDFLSGTGDIQIGLQLMDLDPGGQKPQPYGRIRINREGRRGRVGKAEKDTVRIQPTRREIANFMNQRAAMMVGTPL